MSCAPCAIADQHGGRSLRRQENIDPRVDLQTERAMRPQSQVLNFPRQAGFNLGRTDMPGAAARLRIEERIFVGEIVKGFLPTFPDKTNPQNETALFLAVGIIGATVMPHNLYLHSALVQSRKIDRTDFGIRQAIKFNRIDTTIALNLAFFVNAAILVLAGTLFFGTEYAGTKEIQDAHELLPSFLGKSAPILFAVALIAAGQSSTVTGTLAGQIIMEGY